MKKAFQLLVAGLLLIVVGTAPVWGQARPPSGTSTSPFSASTITLGAAAGTNAIVTADNARWSNGTGHARFNGSEFTVSNGLTVGAAITTAGDVIGAMHTISGAWRISSSTGALQTGFTADGAAATAHRFNTSAAWSGVGAKVVTFENNGTVKGSVDVNTGAYITPVQAFSIASDGAGTTPTGTLTPTSEHVTCTCNDANNCNVTMGETNVQDGHTVTVSSTHATQTCIFADTANVSELAGAFTAGQYDSITLRYVTDRWVEISRSNN